MGLMIGAHRRPTACRRIVVLGVFSCQRLDVDPFANVDSAVVVVIVSDPGAAPEIVESEVYCCMDDLARWALPKMGRTRT